MYLWRQLTNKQRAEALEYRRIQRYPKHSLPHFDREGECRYLLSAACYEHKPIIGALTDRMTHFEAELLATLENFASALYAWCILANHYHVLLKTADMKQLRKYVGELHGRTAFEWNGQDDARGRIVWRNCFERAMKSQRHFFASLNYVLNNAVHHGYVTKWQDWPWSNASDYIEQVGTEEAQRIWREYPINNYGSKWDTF